MKVLIHSNREELDRNIKPVDYSSLPMQKKLWGGNLGNKMFLTSMEVYCIQSGVDYEYLTSDMTSDYINRSFDLILWPLANCFNNSVDIMHYLENYIQILNRYKVPVLALGAGAQANSYDDLSELTNGIKGTASKFIEAVYRTGGTFGLRGYFTGELFERLGYRDYVVTGCPSMYQMGRNLKVEKKPINDENPRIILNGDFRSLQKYLSCHFDKRYTNSWFVDQGEYVFLLYDEMRGKYGVSDVRELMKEYSKLGIRMLADNRVVCLYDLPTLAKKIQHQIRPDFSFGQRIHGNLLSTLLGIPAIVYAHDSRTQELAEFFDIPIYKGKSKKIDLICEYENASWNKFNRTFTDKYDRFERLLCLYGMPQISKSDYCMMTNADKYHDPKKVNDYSFLKSLVNNKIIGIGIN